MYLELSSQMMLLKAGPPCLCLHASPSIAILAADLSPTSAFLSTINIAVAAWIATCVAIV